MSELLLPQKHPSNWLTFSTGLCLSIFPFLLLLLLLNVRSLSICWRKQEIPFVLRFIFLKKIHSILIRLVYALRASSSYGVQLINDASDRYDDTIFCRSPIQSVCAAMRHLRIIFSLYHFTKLVCRVHTYGVKWSSYWCWLLLGCRGSSQRRTPSDTSVLAKRKSLFSDFCGKLNGKIKRALGIIRKIHWCTQFDVQRSRCKVCNFQNWLYDFLLYAGTVGN